MKIDKGTYDRHLRFFDAEAAIFHEGEEGAEMYIITQGRVEIRKATGQSAAKTLTTLHTGDLFGEMALIDRKPRSATAVAVEPTRLLVLNDKLFDRMLVSNPDFARRMIRILSDRIRRANQVIQNLMATSRQNQVWVGLVEYAKEHGVSGFKGFRVKIADFVQWALEHLGMSAKDVESLIEVFLHRHIVQYSARGTDEILVEPKTALALPES
ncbi:MAG: cyclic nucleotide-binding domain-containing protein [Spirochaetes bacterium]|nr:cyclic nucleotide-binding domain-containing protein [Spirochaetota bacterium]